MAENTGATPTPDRGLNGACAALLALGFAPPAVLGLADLWAQPWTRGWPLALVGALALGWRAWREPRAEVRPGGAAHWGTVVGLALAVSLVAALRWSPGLALGAAWLGLVGLVGWLGGRAFTRAWLPAYAVLLIGVGGALATAGGAQTALKDFVLRGADQLLYSLEVPHLPGPAGLELTALTVPRSSVFAGLHGLPGVLTVGLLALLWLRRHPLRIAVVLGATAVLFLPGEVARVAWGARAADLSGVDFFRTWRADAIVLGLWALAVVVLLSVDQFIGFLTGPRARAEGERPALPTAPVAFGPGRTPGARASALAWSCVALALVLGIAQAGFGWLRWQARAEPLPTVSPPLDIAWNLPAIEPGWQAITDGAVIAGTVTRPPRLGIWGWQRRQFTLELTIEGPWREPEDALPGYLEAGWTVEAVASIRASAEALPPRVEASLSRPPMLRAVLYCGWFDESGRWLEGPEDRGGARGASRTIYRVQALAVAARELTETERETARELFDAIRLALANQVRGATGGN